MHSNPATDIYSKLHRGKEHLESRMASGAPGEGSGGLFRTGGIKASSGLCVSDEVRLRLGHEFVVASRPGSLWIMKERTS